MLEVTPKGDEDAYWARLLSQKPQPCFVMRDDLDDQTVIALAHNFCLFYVPLNNGWRHILLFGMEHPESTHPATVQARFEMLKGSDGYSLLEEHTETAVLLSTGITEEQRKGLHSLFVVQEVEIGGVAREQIPLVWYTPQFEVKEKDNGNYQ